MKTKRERMADMLEKVGVVFLAAAFLQADHGGETVLYLAFAVASLIGAIRLSADDSPL